MLGYALLLVLLTGFAAGEVLRFSATNRHPEAHLFPYPLSRLRRRMTIFSLLFTCVALLLFFSAREAIPLWSVPLLMGLLFAALVLALRDLRATLRAHGRSKVRLAQSMMEEVKIRKKRSR
ncbi:MAG: hypothetical protein ABIK09_13840 [Pseudomonadota bacterium]